MIDSSSARGSRADAAAQDAETAPRPTARPEPSREDGGQHTSGDAAVPPDGDVVRPDGDGGDEIPGYDDYEPI